MRTIYLAGCCLAIMLVSACQQPAEAPPTTPEAASEPSYTPIPIDAVDEPGAPRQVRCQLGDEPEETCTLTPLFGDDSFQLDGAGIAMRMVVTGNDGSLFEVFSAERRVPVGGLYRRSSASDPCWVAQEESPTPTPICIR